MSIARSGRDNGLNGAIPCRLRLIGPIHDRYALTHFPLSNNIASSSNYGDQFIKVLMQQRTKLGR